MEGDVDLNFPWKLDVCRSPISRIRRESISPSEKNHLRRFIKMCNGVVRTLRIFVKFPFCSTTVNALSSLIGASLFASCVVYVACARNGPRIMPLYTTRTLYIIIGNTEFALQRNVAQVIQLEAAERETVIASMRQRGGFFDRIFSRERLSKIVLESRGIIKQRQPPSP